MTSKHTMRRTAATGSLLLIASLSFSLVGCSANGNTNHSVTPANSQASATPASQAPKEAPVGDGIMGSGQQVKASDGSTYETLAIDPNSPILKFNNGQGLSSAMSAANYTEADGQASQKLAANYMVKEFIDSTALETKDVAGFQRWLGLSGRDYFTPAVYNDLNSHPEGARVILGDIGGTTTMPNLLHDGKPREKNVKVNVTDVSPFSNNQGETGIKYNFQYSATYRLSATEAANFAAKLGKMTPEQFLQSGKAQPSIKDGKGETTYTATGSVDFVVSKDSTGDWKISGSLTKSDYDVSAFVNNS